MINLAKSLDNLDMEPVIPPIAEPVEVFHDIGRQLKEFREQRKLSVEQVSKGLKIRGTYIRALEEGRFQNLPGNIYAGGYIKNYTDYLGVNGEPLLASFRGAGGRGKDDDSFMLPELTHDEMKPGKLSLLIAALILFALYGIWHVFERRSDIKPYTPETTAMLPPEVKSAKSLEARIVLLAKNDVEISVTNLNGELMHQQLMHSGETYFVPKEALMLKATSPEYIEMFVDGESVVPHGPAVVSEMGILLDPSKLLEASGFDNKDSIPE